MEFIGFIPLPKKKRILGSRSLDRSRREGNCGLSGENDPSREQGETDRSARREAADPLPKMLSPVAGGRNRGARARRARQAEFRRGHGEADL